MLAQINATVDYHDLGQDFNGSIMHEEKIVAHTAIHSKGYASTVMVKLQTAGVSCFGYEINRQIINSSKFAM